MDKAELRARLQRIVGEIELDDPDYDDKRAFILTGGRDLNALWEEGLTSDSPEFQAEIQAKIDENLAELQATILRMDWME